jgi:hypothetical protein
LERRLAKLDGERAEIARAIEALKPAAKAEGLRSGLQSVTLQSMQTVCANIRKKQSKGASPNGAPANVLRFLEACHASELASMRGVAGEVGVNVGQLSQMLRGSKPIRRAMADKIESLIGYKATRANWEEIRD